MSSEADVLVVTPDPMPRESLFGYMLRLTQVNAYDSPWHIYRHAGLQQGEMKTACLPVHKLAAVLGKNPARLEAMSYTRTSVQGDTTYRILTHDLGSGLMTRPFRLDLQGLCPLCVKESGYIDTFWDLRIATACPFHRCKALTQCPTCQEPLRQFRPAPLRCKCGSDLASVSLEIASSAEVELMKVVYARLHDEPGTLGDLTEGLPIDHLINLPMRSLMTHLFRLGAFVLNESCEKSSAARSIPAAADLLANWPNGLFSHLRNKMEHRLPHETSFLKFYGNFYNNFVKTGKRPRQELDWIRNAFLEFGVKEWNGGAVDARLVAQTVERRKLLNRQDLADALRVSCGTVTKWLRNGVIAQCEYVHTDSRRYGFDRSTLGTAATPEGKSEVLETRVAAAYLGIPVPALQFLKENCHVGARNPRLQRAGYFRSDLDRVRQQLLEKAPFLPADSLPNSNALLILGRFLKFSHPRNKSIKGRLLAAILTGSVHPIGRNGDQISTILLKKSDLDRMLHERPIEN